MEEKKHDFGKIGILFCIVLVLLMGSVALLIKQSNSKTSTLSQNPTPTKTYFESLNQTISSPNGKTKLITVFNTKGQDVSLFLESSGLKTSLGTALRPMNFQWSPDLNFISFADGTPSLGTTVYVINLASKKIVPVKGDQTAFQNASGKITYSHIYSTNVDWYDPNTILVKVEAQPDQSVTPPPAQLYLVNAKTGNVVKRIL